MPSLERDGEVYLLLLDADDNRFNPDWFAAVEAALDEVDAAPAPKALVTLGTGKFWSNGLDLEWLSAHTDQWASYLDRVNGLFARTLASPHVTVAALNGHAFGAGAMWALAHDFRVMREDRGYFCLPEVDIEIPFQPAMTALIRARLSPQCAHDAMTTGRRYGGGEALAAAIVDGVAGEASLRDAAVALAAPLTGKAKPVRAQIKEGLYAEVLALLRTPTA